MSIMVPLDTSDLSESAVPKAAELARALDEELLFVTVVSSSLREALREFAESEGEDPVDIIESGLRGVARSLPGVRTRVEMLTGTDDAATSLIDRANQDDVDMVVMASHGRAGVQRWMMGSVSERMVRGATVPVMIVPAPWRVAAHQERDRELAPSFE